jgi:hypothetical protein
MGTLDSAMQLMHSAGDGGREEQAEDSKNHMEAGISCVDRNLDETHASSLDQRTNSGWLASQWRSSMD